MNILQSFSLVTPRERYSLTVLLSNAIESGVPIINAFDLIIKQCRNKKLELVLLKVRKDLESGLSFSDALAKHPNVFSKNYISMIDSAEKSGTLSQALHELADHIEGDVRIRREAISKIYPLVIVSAVLGLILYLFFKVIPQLFD